MKQEFTFEYLVGKYKQVKQNEYKLVFTTPQLSDAAMPGLYKDWGTLGRQLVQYCLKVRLTTKLEFDAEWLAEVSGSQLVLNRVHNYLMMQFAMRDVTSRVSIEVVLGYLWSRRFIDEADLICAAVLKMPLTVLKLPTRVRSERVGRQSFVIEQKKRDHFVAAATVKGQRVEVRALNQLQLNTRITLKLKELNASGVVSLPQTARVVKPVRPSVDQQLLANQWHVAGDTAARILQVSAVPDLAAKLGTELFGLLAMKETIGQKTLSVRAGKVTPRPPRSLDSAAAKFSAARLVQAAVVTSGGRRNAREDGRTVFAQAVYYFAGTTTKLVTTTDHLAILGVKYGHSPLVAPATVAVPQPGPMAARKPVAVVAAAVEHAAPAAPVTRGMARTAPQPPAEPAIEVQTAARQLARTMRDDVLQFQRDGGLRVKTIPLNVNVATLINSLRSVGTIRTVRLVSAKIDGGGLKQLGGILDKAIVLDGATLEIMGANVLRDWQQATFLDETAAALLELWGENARLFNFADNNFLGNMIQIEFDQFVLTVIGSSNITGTGYNLKRNLDVLMISTLQDDPVAARIVEIKDLAQAVDNRAVTHYLALRKAPHRQFTRVLHTDQAAIPSQFKTRVEQLDAGETKDRLREWLHYGPRQPVQYTQVCGTEYFVLEFVAERTVVLDTFEPGNAYYVFYDTPAEEIIRRTSKMRRKSEVVAFSSMKHSGYHTTAPIRQRVERVLKREF